MRWVLKIILDHMLLKKTIKDLRIWSVQPKISSAQVQAEAAGPTDSFLDKLQVANMLG